MIHPNGIGTGPQQTPRRGTRRGCAMPARQLADLVTTPEECDRAIDLASALLMLLLRVRVELENRERPTVA